MTSAHWGIGRNPFPLVEGDNDYSGKDFDSVVLQDSKSLSHAFLNGVTLSNAAFIRADLDQCEFGEAELTKTTFVECLLAGTDFVRATFTDVLFEDCDLTDGEWRESTFTRVRFVRCKFAHTTVNLCSFYDCAILEGSVEGLDYKAVNYNVFSRCTFDGGISNETVLSRNFGLRPTKSSSSVVHFGSHVTLEQVCLLSSSGPVGAFDVVRAIENECANFRGRMKKLRLEFIGNIVRLMAFEARISSSSLIYIEGVLSGLGALVLEDGDPQAVLSAFITVRNALFERVNATLLDTDAPAGIADRLALTYEAQFSRAEGEALAQALDHVLTDGSRTVTLTSVQHGSTIFNIDFQGAVCTAAATWAAVNLLLSQAKTSIKTIKAIKAEFKKRKSAPKPNRDLTRAKKATPALLLSGKEPPELVRLRRAVHQNGMLLVQLDAPAMATLHVREDGMRARED
ncbi:pentapeptide repeat-containing protein [Bradyrhizobium yuanmingense]|uniref:pentapeptide repeat-containing protein n=1 Tax=Bradyrhizobium yuanmingense TaxID=108015 RepID=UPI0023B8C533|nr:pentapeptide repeat-containing protein [Bradyrhizobium yuanmingense]MDF0585124.1 pentapeptide repeat-containing protein [Bradyrhizobium yuanmingense]